MLSFAGRPLGFRKSARKRLAAYLKWLEDKARRRREYQRYLAALAAQRKAGDKHSEQVRTRIGQGLETSVLHRIAFGLGGLWTKANPPTSNR